MVDYNALADFRNGLFDCFGNGRDALMNTCDALLCELRTDSFAALSLSPFFDRRWPSLYEAFDDAKIDRDRLRRLFINTMPPVPQSGQKAPAAGRLPGKHRLLAADITPILRPESPTARDRTYVHVSNAPKGSKPVAPGWQFATTVAVTDTPSSWTTILENTRVTSEQTPGEAIAAQLARIAPDLPKDAIVTLDGAFGNATFMKLVCQVLLCKLMRVAKSRVFYRQPPPSPEKRGRGRPRVHGDPFDLKRPETHGDPDAHWSGQDDQDHEIEVACWHNLHFKTCRDAPLTLVRITRHNGADTTRNPRTIWLIWQGPTPLPPVDEIPQIYRLRYCIEHSYRFDKQELHWADPRLRTPEKFQAWTDIVAAVHNQITLARQYQEAVRQPWAKRNTEATPQQVRAGLPAIIGRLGTPARPPQPRGKSPGRSRGAVVKKAARCKVIYKQAA